MDVERETTRVARRTDGNRRKKNVTEVGFPSEACHRELAVMLSFSRNYFARKPLMNRLVCESVMSETQRMFPQIALRMVSFQGRNMESSGRGS